MRYWRMYLVMVFVFGIVSMSGLAFSADEANVFSKSEKLTLTGDVRVRHEYRTREPGSTNDTDRERLRFRFGGTAKVNDQVNVGFGFGTGSSDTPLSTNQTLEQEFQSKQIWLDYAYATVDPFSWLHLTGGKFKSIFLHTDMLWDSDIRFDGFAAELRQTFEDVMVKKLYVSGGYFPILNRGTHTDDIYLLVGSGGMEGTCPMTGIKGTLGVTYFSFENLKGATTASLAEERNTNTYVGGALKNDYKVLVPSIKLSLKKIGGLLAEYAQNGEASKSNNAYRIGGWIGSAKAKKPGEFRILTQFTFLQTDAIYDAFPDADFSRGGTNGKGWEIILDYVVAKNTILSMNFYKTRNITGALAEEEILQTDFIVKF